MTETQQRFLRAIAERVPVDQVVELHLFPPIRQGGVETGVAVVAEAPAGPVPNAEPGTPDAESPSMSAETPAAPEIVGATDDAVAPADEIEIEIEAEPVEIVAEATGDPREDSIVVDADDESPYADDEDDDDTDAYYDSEGDETDEVVVADEVVAESNGHARAPFSRLTIHTARYRLTLKGVDRGKWEVDVVAEADAPLEALDAVVRGVQRRAGEGAEPDRLNAEAFRDALEAPLATLER